MNDLKSTDLPDLKTSGKKGKAKPKAQASKTSRSTISPASTPKTTVTSARHNAEANGIASPDHDKQTYVQKPPVKAETHKTDMKADQTNVLLVSCPAKQITDIPAGEYFSDLRVGSKWFKAVKEGDKLPVHLTEVGPDFVPNDGVYPAKGEKIATVEVVAKLLLPSLNTALDASAKGVRVHGNLAKNHLVMANQSRAALESLVRYSYPTAALKKAGAEQDNGFSLLVLKRV